MNQGLMKIEGGGIAERPTFDLAETQQIGAIFVKSGFFKDTKDASQAIVKIMAGAELGLGPMASMAGIYIVKGKVSLSANLMAAAVRRSRRYDYKLRTLTAEICSIEFFEGKESLGFSEFTMKEAIAGKLTQDYDQDTKQWKDKATWKNFPKNMLFSRAMSNGVKWYCPELTSGPAYTPDELGVEEDYDGNPVIAHNTEPTSANIKREYPELKPVKTAAEEIAEIKADLRKGLPPDWTDAEFEAAWQKKGYHKYANPAALRAKIEEGRQKVAVKVEEPAEVETAPLVEVVDTDPATGLTLDQATQRAELTIKIEDVISKLDAAIGPEKSGKIVLAHSGGESYEDFDLYQLQKFYAALSEDVGTL